MEMSSILGHNHEAVVSGIFPRIEESISEIKQKVKHHKHIPFLTLLNDIQEIICAILFFIKLPCATR